MKTLTPEDLRALTDRKAKTSDRVRALSRLAHWERGKHDHLEATIAGLFDDPDPMVRGSAYKTLLAWRREKYLSKAARALASDPAYDVRRDAAFALGQYGLARSEEAKKIARWLLDSLRRDEDTAVQRATYEALIGLVDPALDAPDPDTFNRETDVDWRLLERFVAE